MPDPLKIDIHTHILPRDWPDLRQRYGYGGWVQLDHCAPCRAKMVIDGRSFREVESNCWDPVIRMSECDDAGVDVQVLSTVPVMFGYWAKANDALDLSRILNDHIAEICRAHPTRFVGLGTVPMQRHDLAAAELERCVKDLGLAGIQIGTHVQDDNLNESPIAATLGVAADLGAAVFVHPWDMMGKEQMPRYWLPWLVGMPAESSRAICSVLFGGVLERWPHLRIAFAHGGGSFPSTIGRIEHGWRVRPDLCRVDNDVNPRDYLGKFYLDSLVHDADALRYLVKLVGAERVALGSDYPFPLGEARPGELIESMGDLSADTRARLLAGTALEWLGIASDRFVRSAETTDAGR